MDEWLPKPQEQGWLEPPRRRPPTAVGVATPEPPRGPRIYRETRMQRVGRAFSKLAVSTGLGLAAASFIPVPFLVALLVVLVGGRSMLLRRRSRLSRLMNLGSSSIRRAA